MALGGLHHIEREVDEAAEDRDENASALPEKGPDVELTGRASSYGASWPIESVERRPGLKQATLTDETVGRRKVSGF